MKQRFLLAILFLAFAISGIDATSMAEDQSEDNYSISLVKTAEEDRELIELDGKKVLAEQVTIKKGDRIWNLLRERELLSKQKLSDLLYDENREVKLQGWIFHFLKGGYLLFPNIFWKIQ